MKKSLREQVREYVNSVRLGKERLALGSDISVRTVDEILRGHDPRASTKSAILNYLTQQKKKIVA